MLDDDKKCDLNCPPIGNYSPYKYCCFFCKDRSETGCKLGNDRPEICKEYDCKENIYFISFHFNGTQWERNTFLELNRNCECDKEFADKYNTLIQDKYKQLCFRRGPNV